MKLARVALFVVGCAVTAGCDAGKAPYDEGVSFEEQGKNAEAGEKYEAVCRRAPDSKFCQPAKERFDAVRMKLADADIQAGRYAQARTTLKAVVDGGGPGKTRAEDALAADELTEGLKLEAALVSDDKTEALKVIERVAATKTRAASSAAEWLKKERPGILLDQARRACATTPSDECKTICSALLELHAESPQAVQARTLLERNREAEAQRALAEEQRLYDLLVGAEEKLDECARLQRKMAARDQCMKRGMLANLDGDPGQVILACGGPGTDEENARPEALRRELNEIGQKTEANPEGQAFKQRIEEACEHGKYQKRKRGPRPGEPPAAAK
jgi:hypothetical protein